MKTMKILFVGLAIILSAATAFAHSPMKATSPVNNAKLEAVPAMLHLEFTKQARVLKVIMTHRTAEASHEMRLKLPTRDFVTEMHLTPNFMGAGHYKVEWRALGEDGHAIKGEFGFDVAAQ